MKMRKFYMNKLWRDQASLFKKDDGSIIHLQILNDAEYNNELGLKLIEEATEVHMAQSPDELMDELGDVLEVIDCIVKFHKLSKDEILNRQQKKREDRGSYEERKFVSTAEFAPDSYGEKYCLKDPERYPEI